jgi:sugar lactone lactonase YvrE
MKDARAEENGISGIFKYDLNTKKLIKKYLLPAQPNHHWLGDLALDSSGDVFASDSISPAIFRIDHQKDELELFLESRDFVNPQGLAFTADEKHLYLADYLKGLFIIDMKTKVAALFQNSACDEHVRSDGLYYYKGRLIGIQRCRPNREVELTLTAPHGNTEAGSH